MVLISALHCRRSYFSMNWKKSSILLIHKCSRISVRDFSKQITQSATSPHFQVGGTNWYPSYVTESKNSFHLIGSWTIVSSLVEWICCATNRGEPQRDPPNSPSCLMSHIENTLEYHYYHVNLQSPEESDGNQQEALRWCVEYLTSRRAKVTKSFRSCHAIGSVLSLFSVDPW